MAEIITFINQKGGVGKTSLAMNFGIRLKMAGARVLLVDMDPQCNLTYIMGVDDPPHTIYEVMLRQVSAANAIVQAGECDLIAASPNLSTLNLTLSGSGKEFYLRDALRQIVGLYDFIVIHGQQRGDPGTGRRIQHSGRGPALRQYSGGTGFLQS